MVDTNTRASANRRSGPQTKAQRAYLPSRDADDNFRNSRAGPPSVRCDWFEVEGAQYFDEPYDEREIIRKQASERPTLGEKPDLAQLMRGVSNYGLRYVLSSTSEIEIEIEN